MSKAVKEIRTVSDLRRVLRSDSNLKFPTMADLDAWETLEKHAGRTTGERLTAQTLRRLEILVADHFGLKMYVLTRETLQEFARLCNRALGNREAGTRGSRPKRGRRADTDPVHDAKLANAWQAGEYGTYKDGARFLTRRFPGLTERQLRLAVDRHRHRVRQPASE